MCTYVYSMLCFLLLKIHNHHLKRIERLQKPFQFENIASTRWRLVMMEWVASTRALEVDFFSGEGKIPTKRHRCRRTRILPMLGIKKLKHWKDLKRASNITNYYREAVLVLKGFVCRAMKKNWINPTRKSNRITFDDVKEFQRTWTNKQTTKSTNKQTRNYWHNLRDLVSKKPS